MLGFRLDVLWTARYDYPRGGYLEQHEHSYFQMIYFVSGRGLFHLGGKELVIRPGLLFLIPPNTQHGFRGNSVVKTLDIKFHVDRGRLAKALLAAPSVAALDDPAIPVLFERIRAEGEGKHPYYREVCSALLQELLLLYLRHHSGAATETGGTVDGAEKSPSPFLRRALAFLQQNYARDVAMREIGEALGCSERSVRQHFGQSLGIRPLEYLQRYRIARAKELMAYSGDELKKVAGRVGFKTVQHFTRVFSTVEGTTPGAWRRKYYEGIRKDVNINPQFSNPSWTPAAEQSRRRRVAE